jgi:hypothetical protein
MKIEDIKPLENYVIVHIIKDGRKAGEPMIGNIVCTSNEDKFYDIGDTVII